ncbi:MAG TPA: AAA family ATPase [Thermoanaerobacterales bacterium]|nr:AAA family ATPase [Thermoanaerobacterales bacterium]
MGFIKSLKLINFQSHKETHINFHEGLTVILGQTDQGKSAIIRALKWVLYNEPRGTDFITAGCKNCRVELEMRDGSVIIRERDGNRNRYILKQNGQEQIFEGFGNTVPLEIVKVHGIPKVYIDRDATSAANLAEQLEPPFLISESGSNKAKALGRLVGIHIIDAAQRITLKDLMDYQQRYKLLERNISQLTTELESYKDIDEIAKKISHLNNILEKLKQKRNILLKLTQLKEEFEPTNREINKNQDILLKLNFIETAEQNMKVIDGLYSKYQYLCQIKNKLMTITDSIEAEQKVINMTQNLPPVERLYTTILEFNQMQNKLIKINLSLKDIDKNTQQIKKVIQNTANIHMAHKTLHEAEKLFEVAKNYISSRSKWELINHQLELQKQEVALYTKIEKSELYLNHLLQKMTTLLFLQKTKESIATVDSSISKGKAYLQNLEESLTAMAKEYSRILEKFSICPTCLKPIDKNTIQKIVSDILY